MPIIDYYRRRSRDMDSHSCLAPRPGLHIGRFICLSQPRRLAASQSLPVDPLQLDMGCVCTAARWFPLLPLSNVS